MSKSFYGKNLTSQERIDWILNNIEETNKKNEKEVLDEKGDAVDVLNEEFLDTVFLLTVILAITDALYLLCVLIIDLEQFFLTIKSSGKSIKKYLSFINFLVFRTASPVPLGLF